MRRWQTVAVAVGWVTVGAGLALVPQAVRAGEAERKATLALMKIVVPRETYQEMVARMTAAVRDSYVQSGAPVPAKFESRMAAVMSEAVPYDTLVNWSADIYGSRFSVKEIEQISAFYGQPVGRKLVAELPEISAEIMQKTAETVRTKLPILLKKHGLLPDDEAATEVTPTTAP